MASPSKHKARLNSGWQRERALPARFAPVDSVKDGDLRRARTVRCGICSKEQDSAHALRPVTCEETMPDGTVKRSLTDACAACRENS